ncbi:hypothetical protein RFE93_005481 [Klebsiella pneumoniae]|nr:hypothetical protein [Klebsiella pneumoniae]
MMEKEQNQCCQQPLLHQDVSPTTSRVTFSTDKKVLTAEQYIGATLREKMQSNN